MAMRRKSLWIATAVYLVQIPIVLGYGAGWIPIHPIVVMLPLVGFLNDKVEQRGWEGLGLIVVQPGRSLLLALLFAALHFGGQLVTLRLESIPLQPLPLTLAPLGMLVGDFALGVFIIALWEEIVSRGYVQTRLQEAWGFWGVIVASLLFSSLHLPSAFLDFGYDIPTALFHFVQVGLVGFMLGYVYWQTGSVLTAIVLHGLRNFAWAVSLRLGNITPAQMHVSQMSFQFLWLVGQVGLMLFVCRALFGSNRHPSNSGAALPGLSGEVWGDVEKHPSC
jgi:membrane protease YdiL (CAAX protease family)